jgi:hypothetical protein
LIGRNFVFPAEWKQRYSQSLNSMKNISRFCLLVLLTRRNFLSASLPYAFALGVEHAWAEQFSQVLAQAATAGLRQRHRLFAFMVYRRGAGFILNHGFYFEL